MAEHHQSTAANRTNEGFRKDPGGHYGRGSSFEGDRALQGYGREVGSEQYSRSRSHDQEFGRGRDHVWNAHTGELATLAIGAGLGFLTGWLAARPGQITKSWRETRPAFEQGRTRFQSGGINADETTDLIASSKVEGTAVYDHEGNQLGEIRNFMVGKRSGRVAYAVLNFGGMMGIGARQYPVPWNALTYDTRQGGYVVDLDKDRLNAAPSHLDHEDAFADPSYGRRINEYWSSMSGSSLI